LRKIPIEASPDAGSDSEGGGGGLSISLLLKKKKKKKRKEASKGRSARLLSWSFWVIYWK